MPPLLATAARIEADLRVGRHAAPAVGRRMTATTDAAARPAPGGASARAVDGVAIAIVLLALNLRTLVAGLPPLLEDIRDDLGALRARGRAADDAAGARLRRVRAAGAAAVAAGARSSGCWSACALLTAVAAALRGAGGVAPLFLGCALAGFAVAIAQALLPVFIRARHPEATGVLTGAYSMSLTLGAALAAALAVPLEEWLGSWEASLAAWSVPALVAAAVWAADRAARPEPGRAASRRRGCGATGWRGT